MERLPRCRRLHAAATLCGRSTLPPHRQRLHNAYPRQRVAHRLHHLPPNHRPSLAPTGSSAVPRCSLHGCSHRQLMARPSHPHLMATLALPPRLPRVSAHHHPRHRRWRMDCAMARKDESQRHERGSCGKLSEKKRSCS